MKYFILVLFHFRTLIYKYKYNHSTYNPNHHKYANSSEKSQATYLFNTSWIRMKPEVMAESLSGFLLSCRFSEFETEWSKQKWTITYYVSISWSKWYYKYYKWRKYPWSKRNPQFLKESTCIPKWYYMFTRIILIKK